MMGDVMIQPTMYFYLSNVPMFHGTYYIMEVNHSIKGNSVETSFKGVRISNSSLPKMSDSFVASYRPLFSRILSAALRKKQQLANQVKSEKNFDFKNKGRKNIFTLCYIMKEIYFNPFIIPNIKFIFARYNGIIIAA